MRAHWGLSREAAGFAHAASAPLALPGCTGHDQPEGSEPPAPRQPGGMGDTSACCPQFEGSAEYGAAVKALASAGSVSSTAARRAIVRGRGARARRTRRAKGILLGAGRREWGPYDHHVVRREPV